MPSSITLLQELLPHLDAYLNTPERAHGLADFASWLQETTEPPWEPPQTAHPSIDAQIGEYLYLLNRYIRAYSKAALKDAPLASLDDFVLLMHLNGEAQTKSAAIEQSQLDFNTGIGIIRRLLQQGILREFSDQADRRAKRITVTGSGKQVMEAVLAQMSKVITMVVGDLPASEKQALLRTLMRLEEYHQQHKALHLSHIQAASELDTEK